MKLHMDVKKKHSKKKKKSCAEIIAYPGNFLEVQWLGLHTSTAGGSIPGRGTKIPQAALCDQRKKKKS